MEFRNYSLGLCSFSKQDILEIDAYVRENKTQLYRFFNVKNKIIVGAAIFRFSSALNKPWGNDCNLLLLEIEIHQIDTDHFQTNFKNKELSEKSITALLTNSKISNSIMKNCYKVNLREPEKIIRGGATENEQLDNQVEEVSENTRLKNSILAKTKQHPRYELSLAKATKKVINKLLQMVSSELGREALGALAKGTSQGGPLETINADGQSSSSFFNQQKKPTDFQRRAQQQKHLNKVRAKSLNERNLKIKLKKPGSKRETNIGVEAFVNPNQSTTNQKCKDYRQDIFSKNSIPRTKTMSQKAIEKIRFKTRLERIKLQSVKVKSSSYEEPTSPPTFEAFGADPKTYLIKNRDRAYHNFRSRMKEVAKQYVGKKRTYFLNQLNRCSKERYFELATENNRMTYGTALEAETMLQFEFEGYY